MRVIFTVAQQQEQREISGQRLARAMEFQRKGSQSHQGPVGHRYANIIGILGEAGVAKLFGVPWWKGGPDGGKRDLLLPSGRPAAIKCLTNRRSGYASSLNRPDIHAPVGILCHPVDRRVDVVDVMSWVDRNDWNQHRWSKPTQDGKWNYWTVDSEWMHPIEDLLRDEEVIFEDEADMDVYG